MSDLDRNRREAYDFMRAATPGDRLHEWNDFAAISAFAMTELIERHEKLCEAVLGILTENPPETIGMSNAGYRQHLRDMVLVALNGQGASVQ